MEWNWEHVSPTTLSTYTYESIYTNNTLSCIREPLCTYMHTDVLSWLRGVWSETANTGQLFLKATRYDPTINCYAYIKYALTYDITIPTGHLKEIFTSTHATRVEDPHPLILLLAPQWTEYIVVPKVTHTVQTTHFNTFSYLRKTGFWNKLHKLFLYTYTITYFTTQFKPPIQ